MLKLFKNLFGSGSTETHTNGNGHTATPPTPPVQVRARAVPANQAAQSAQAAAARSVAAMPTPRPAAPAPRPVGDGSNVQIPLYTIIAVLPLELKTRIRQSMVAEIFVMLPVQRVLEQLGTGSVRITFGELRELAPKVFSVQTDLDATEIPLPLNEILPQINPAMLPRRQQRQVEVSEDIRGPFGNEAAGVTIGDSRTAPIAGMPAQPVQPVQPEMIKPAPMPAQTVRPAPAQPMQPIQPVQPIRPAMPAQQPMKPVMPAQPMMPAQPAQAIKPAFPIPSAKPATPATPQMPRPPMPGMPAQPPRPPAAPVQPPQAPAPAHAPLADAPLIQFRPSSITSTPTPRPPTAAPAVPPVRPAMPPARGAGVPGAPLPTMAPMTPRMPMNGGGNGHPPVPTMPAAPVIPQMPQQAAPVAPVAPAAPAAPEVCLNVPMAMVMENWPEVLRAEAEQLQLTRAQLALPMRLVEPALKQGRLAFPWNVIRSWVRPAPLPSVSAHDGVVLELPLRIIAPLFIARQRNSTQPKQKVQINEKIPNLFFGFPQPDAAPVEEAPVMPVAPEPVAFTPAPAPAAPIPMAPVPMSPVSRPAPVQQIPDQEIPEVIFQPKAAAPAAAQPKPPVPTDTNFYVWGEAGETPVEEVTEVKKSNGPGTDFLSRYATPNEVVSRAASLDGVAGALVALPDGLMVASKLAPDLNGDTLAAFLPHIFGKVNQCTKELRMGELNNLNFTVGNVPWKIFRVNAIFFAAFGTAGKALPTAQLAALAGELDRKK